MLSNSEKNQNEEWNKMYEKIDLNNFWNSDSEYDDLKSEPFSEETLRDIEKDLGYKFPQSYIALMRIQNGGCPENTSVGNTGWVIGSIYGISKDTDFRFWTDEDLAPLIPVCTSESLYVPRPMTAT